MGVSLIAGLFATWCLGRFTIALPQIPLHGRADTVQGVDVTVMPGGGKDPGQLWQDRLARLHALRPPEGLASAVVRTLDRSGGLGQAVYFGNEFAPDTIDVETAAALPPALVIFTKAVPTGEEAQALAHIDTVAAALRPMAAGEVTSAAAYCLRAGVVMLPPSGPEATALTIESDDARTHVEVTIQTVARPKDIDREPEYHEIETEARKAGAPSERLRLGLRSLSGLDGFEAAHKVAEHDEPEFRGSWEFPGAPGHAADRPFISIQVKFPYGPSALADWDRILSSLRHKEPPSR